ncbi:class I SAM-dependent methyltransferase [Celerinatantimonas diazotrophica]|uniref:Phospholipid N-methyltransferase n=1 Tax=Celerinatantimonas diazotrophica TaxID=412034 RepID=A0A4V6NE70_9GAMM|nr:rRNA adenine N-6-methyltransferase family protein [Celerinatantimonas diazotrophica]TCK51791.1 phospholipid N-methyltransferase [Celerinatantimonas diazotrophica]CAG9296517.1 Ribosomal RNA small subunit methyltransferase A [Celerinatantimonas diazotrophica]
MPENQSLFRRLTAPMSAFFQINFIHSKILFARQFLSTPRTVGAIAPSSRFLARKMVEQIDFNSARCIVEIGPGTGVFTDLLIKRRSDHCEIILIETNEVFVQQLNERYGHLDNVRIIHDSGEKINLYKMKYGIEHIDYIVSGIPFSSLPAQVSTNILSTVNKALSPNGRFILFQYSLMKVKTITTWFDITFIERSWANLPPAYVFTCRSKQIQS